MSGKNAESRANWTACSWFLTKWARFPGNMRLSVNLCLSAVLIARATRSARLGGVKLLIGAGQAAVDV